MDSRDQSEDPGRRSQSGPVRRARECGAAVRQRATPPTPVSCSRTASPTTTTPRSRRSPGSRCSICCSAWATTPSSISCRCNTWSRSSVRRQRARSAAARRGRAHARSAAGYVGLTGKLNAGHAPQIANLLAASQKQSQLRLDLGSLTGADDAGAKLLADALAQLRRRQYPLALQHPEKIRNALEHSVVQGRGAGEGYWILLLELLQWQNDHKVFEDRAVEFAVAFEVSPPSWEPPPSSLPAEAVGDPPRPPRAAPDNPEMLVWQGTMLGSSDPQLAKLAMFGDGRHAIPIDMGGSIASISSAPVRFSTRSAAPSRSASRSRSSVRRRSSARCCC